MEIRDFSDFGPFRADVRRRVLLRDGQPVSLPGKAFDVLALLVQNAGTTVAKDDILKAVWPDTFVEEGNLTQTVFLLRKALGDSDSQPYIVTVPRQGYRFVGSVANNTSAPRVYPVAAKGLETGQGKAYGRRTLAMVALAAGVVGVLATVVLRFISAPSAYLPEPVRFEIPFEDAAVPVISPDGKRMALTRVDRGASGTGSIWIRDMNGTVPYSLAGTENADHVFWSPDSCCLAFLAQGKLKTVNVAGGPVKIVSDAPNGRGGAWSQSGVILFAPVAGGPLHTVPATGGVSTPVTSVDAARNENSHRWPVFLPDGRKFIYFAQSASRENLWLKLGELGRSDSRPLIRSDSNAVYVQKSPDAGVLLYVTNRALVAQPFNARRGEFTGETRVIAKSVRYDAASKFACFTASSGILAYRTQEEQPASLRWFSRQGGMLSQVAEGQGFRGVFLSRDGSVLAWSRMDPEAGTGDIWTFDLNRGAANRVTRNPAWESMPVLSPDNKEVVFASDRPPRNAYVKTVEGSSPERPLVPPPAAQTQRNPYDWSSDGKFILFAVFDKGNEDLWVFETATHREFPLVQTSFNESQGQFSPDGKWIAYTSDETGNPEVYVREFLPPDKLADHRTKISVDGGTEPRWRQDGKELFYIEPHGGLMAVPIQAGNPIRAGKPVVVFNGKLQFGFGWHSTFSYAVGGNGQKFVLATQDRPTVISPITVVLNAPLP
ncbi:MAG: winged helix-turn-helix domain-containing protein [Bryobacteraceae bacterium]